MKKLDFGQQRKLRLNLWCWAFMTPSLLLYGLFQGWPILVSWYYAMLDWSGLSTRINFVGLQNFMEVAQDKYFWNAYLNSFKFMLGVVPLKLISALFIALILNNTRLKGRNAYRTVFFLPVISVASIIGIIMIFILGSGGPVNGFLLFAKVLKQPVNWLGDPKWAMIAVIVVSAWKNMGTDMIYWLAGLQSVPQELYEAARVDGANAFNTFRYITFPLILPIGAIITLLDVVGSLKVFDIIKTMTEGGPFFATDVVATYIYRYAFSSEMGLPRLGYASAAGIFFGLTIVVIAVLQSVITKSVKRPQQN
jgi:ABC-type sugar transport system permease subunit